MCLSQLIRGDVFKTFLKHPKLYVSFLWKTSKNSGCLNNAFEGRSKLYVLPISWSYYREGISVDIRTGINTAGYILIPSFQCSEILICFSFVLHTVISRGESRIIGDNATIAFKIPELFCCLQSSMSGNQDCFLIFFE